MSNSCEQTPTLSKTAEIADNIGWDKNNPLQWSRIKKWKHFSKIILKSSFLA